jgi:hypothetical protein
VSDVVAVSDIAEIVVVPIEESSMEVALDEFAGALSVDVAVAVFSSGAGEVGAVMSEVVVIEFESMLRRIGSESDSLAESAANSCGIRAPVSESRAY